MGESVTEKIARFVTGASFEDIPQSVKDQSKLAILDWFAAYLAALAVAMEQVTPLLEMIKEFGGKEKVRVIGMNKRTDVISAATTNGYIGHLLDYDESTPSIRSHSTASVLPAVLAVGEERKISGRRLLESFAVGQEVTIKIGEAMHPEWLREGWHGTGIFGGFGCTAGSGKILGLGAEKMASAIGIAASFASGISENFGSSTKPFHAAKAARDGILAGFLADKGITSKKTALDGKAGFYHAYNWGDMKKIGVIDTLGKPWRLETWGAIAPKLNPCCHGLATSIECGAIMFKKYGFPPDAIEEIEIYSHMKTLSAMISRSYVDTGELMYPNYLDGPPRQLLPGIPKTEKEAQFSKEYGFCKAFLEGELKIEHFTAEAIKEPKVVELMKKTKVFHCPRMEKISISHPEIEWSYAERMVVKLKDGRVCEEEQHFVRGGAKRPLTMKHVEEKFIDYATRAGLARKKITDVIAKVHKLEEVEDISKFLDLFEGGTTC
ncbi:MAG: MmgE/PrpD family protein [Syntrophales bacterium]|nr:MmgE/PrpD family protein [Syntrophales bacterium]